MVDLVIRGGTVIDGGGGDPFEADVAVEAGKIVGIGEVSARGKEEIDARGKIVTPGFVDPHSHYDAQATWRCTRCRRRERGPSRRACNGITPISSTRRRHGP